MSNETENNSFKDKLQQKAKEVKECQQQKNIDDCLKCDQAIGCTLRNEYVVCVYESMNKGESGGFEF
jgi:recombinational DNA repair protein RecR